MKIFNGKKEAEKILSDLKKRIKKLKVFPKLAVIFIDGNKASKLYIKKKKEAGKKVGIGVKLFKFKKTAAQKDIVEKIKNLNQASSIQGIIVQLPLPEKFNTGKIIETIDPKKDVDGFHRINRSLLKKGQPYFFPVLPQVILIALKGAAKSYENRKISALVNSEIFGKTLKDFLKRKSIKINYILAKNLSLSKIKEKLKSADVIISVCQKPKWIKGEMIKKGAILIDGSIALRNKEKLWGDVDRKSVAGKASFLTPVPGGLGPLTVALLLRNVYLAAKNAKKDKI